MVGTDSDILPREETKLGFVRILRHHTVMMDDDDVVGQRASKLQQTWGLVIIRDSSVKIILVEGCSLLFLVVLRVAPTTWMIRMICTLSLFSFFPFFSKRERALVDPPLFPNSYIQITTPRSSRAERARGALRSFAKAVK